METSPVEGQIRKYLPKLNINDPKFGAWVGGNHQRWSKAYQRDWERFLQQKRSSKEVKKFAREMGNKYGFKVNF